MKNRSAGTSESDLELAIHSYVVTEKANSEFRFTYSDIKNDLVRKGYFEPTKEDLIRDDDGNPMWYRTMYSIWSHRTNSDNFFNRGVFFRVNKKTFAVDHERSLPKTRRFKNSGDRTRKAPSSVGIDKWLALQVRDGPRKRTHLLDAGIEQGYTDKMVDKAYNRNKNLEWFKVDGIEYWQLKGYKDKKKPTPAVLGLTLSEQIDVVRTIAMVCNSTGWAGAAKRMFKIEERLKQEKTNGEA